MDGSIADSTVLRMRTQLQRMHHASPTTPADGFLEELLKLPATPAVEPREDTQPADPTLDSVPTTAASQTDKDKKSADKEPSDSDEQADTPAAPCVPMCYGPAQLPVPQAVEPTAEAEPAVAVVEPNTITTAVVDEQVAQPTAVAETSDVVDSVDTLPVVAESTADEIVQPVEANVPPLNKDSLSKSVRDVRRVKEPRDKSDAPTADPQVVSKQPTAETAEPTRAVEAKTTKEQQPVVDQAQAVDPNATAEPSPVADAKSTRDDDRSQRDKWYEKSNNYNDDQGQAAAADRVGDQQVDQAKAESKVEAVNTESLSDLSAAAVDASPLLADATAQTSLDASQIASDMLATVQASSTQNAATQSVTESSSVAGVDAARGRSSVPSNTVSVNASTGSRGSASAGSAAASSKESPDAPREITQLERVRLVQRVARSFSRLGPEGGQVTLKLHPPQLGVLNVSIKIEGQSMTARLQTETSAARDTIVENLPVLRDRLSEQGIEIEKFQVEVGQPSDMTSSGGQSGNFTGNDASSQQNNSSAATEFDYRRVARGNASRPNVVSPAIMEPKLQGWSAPGRSLDVRA